MGSSLNFAEMDSFYKGQIGRVVVLNTLPRDIRWDTVKIDI